MDKIIERQNRQKEGTQNLQQGTKNSKNVLVIFGLLYNPGFILKSYD